MLGVLILMRLSNIHGCSLSFSILLCMYVYVINIYYPLSLTKYRLTYINLPNEHLVFTLYMLIKMYRVYIVL